MPIALLPRSQARSKAIPSRCPLPGIALLGLWGCVGLACAGAKPPVETRLLPPRPAHAIDVQLGFDAAADLDLHVTDPDLETVYFGNSPSRSGGWLDADVRCEGGEAGAPHPRRETVRLVDPVPGRYRVGVDYVKSCRRFRSEARYSIRVVGPDFELERSGRIGPGRFENAALEFDWPPGTPVESAGD